MWRHCCCLEVNSFVLLMWTRTKPVFEARNSPIAMHEGFTSCKLHGHVVNRPGITVRSDAMHYRSARVLRCLHVVLVLLSVANQSHSVRIPLETIDHLRFTGVVYVGSPPRRVHVVFDTGSSDTWVSSVSVANEDERAPSRAFTIGYGGGVVSGIAAPADLQLGSNHTDRTLLSDVPVGFVDDHSSVLPGLDAQGVVGLGMEALAQIHRNSSLLGLLAQQRLLQPLVFSLYISSWSQAQPASQIIIGDGDPALSSAHATWFTFPVVSNTQSSKASYGFWALRVQNLSFGNATLPFRPSGVAVLDSGTSVLLLPQHTFDSVVHVLSVRFGTRLLNDKRSLPVCRPCHAHEFPPLAFAFSNAVSQRFELHGSDYVRCDHRRLECTAMIDVVDSSEVSEQLDVVVFGTVFFRAYYTRFDYSNEHVSLACTLNGNAVCRGGLQPALDYHGRPYKQNTPRHWGGLGAAVTALALFAGLRTLLTLHQRIYNG